MSGTVIQKAFFKIHLQFLIKVPQITAKLLKSKNLQFFDIFGNFTKIQRKFDWLGYTQPDENKNRCLVSS